MSSWLVSVAAMHLTIKGDKLRSVCSNSAAGLKFQPAGHVLSVIHKVIFFQEPAFAVALLSQAGAIISSGCMGRTVPADNCFDEQLGRVYMQAVRGLRVCRR